MCVCALNQRYTYTLPPDKKEDRQSVEMIA